MVKYSIYTDGAWSSVEGLTASAYMIRTKNTFIASGVKVYHDGTIADAEDTAIGLGLKALLENVDVKPDDVINIYTDSLAAINLLKTTSTAKGPNFRLKKRVKAVWYLFRDISEKYNVRLVQTQSHLQSWNGNSVVDRMARYHLRMIVRKNKEEQNSVCTSSKRDSNSL